MHKLNFWSKNLCLLLWVVKRKKVEELLQDFETKIKKNKKKINHNGI